MGSGVERERKKSRRPPPRSPGSPIDEASDFLARCYLRPGFCAPVRRLLPIKILLPERPHRLAAARARTLAEVSREVVRPPLPREPQELRQSLDLVAGE